MEVIVDVVYVFVVGSGIFINSIILIIEIFFNFFIFEFIFLLIILVIFLNSFFFFKNCNICLNVNIKGIDINVEFIILNI